MAFLIMRPDVSHVASPQFENHVQIFIFHLPMMKLQEPIDLRAKKKVEPARETTKVRNPKFFFSMKKTIVSRPYGKDIHLAATFDRLRAEIAHRSALWDICKARCSFQRWGGYGTGTWTPVKLSVSNVHIFVPIWMIPEPVRHVLNGLLNMVFQECRSALFLRWCICVRKQEFCTLAMHDLGHTTLVSLDVMLLSRSKWVPAYAVFPFTSFWLFHACHFVVFVAPLLGFCSCCFPLLSLSSSVFWGYIREWRWSSVTWRMLVGSSFCSSSCSFFSHWRTEVALRHQFHNTKVSSISVMSILGEVCIPESDCEGFLLKISCGIRLLIIISSSSSHHHHHHLLLLSLSLFLSSSFLFSLSLSLSLFFLFYFQRTASGVENHARATLCGNPAVKCQKLRESCDFGVLEACWKPCPWNVLLHKALKVAILIISSSSSSSLSLSLSFFFLSLLPLSLSLFFLFYFQRTAVASKIMPEQPSAGIRLLSVKNWGKVAILACWRRAGGVLETVPVKRFAS